MNPVRYAHSARMAHQLLNELSIKIFPLDLESICQKKGWKLMPLTLLSFHMKIPPGKLKKAYLRSDEGGVICANGQYAIIYNDSKSRYRYRFTIAHEIGHICLGHYSEDGSALWHEWLPDDPAYLAMELEANHFAVNLLAPLEAVDYFETFTPELIRRKFNVSLETATYRLEAYNRWKVYNPR